MANFDKIKRVLRFNRKPFTRISREARWEDGNILLCRVLNVHAPLRGGGGLNYKMVTLDDF